MPNQIMANGSQLIPGTDLNPLIVLLKSFRTEASRPDMIPKGMPKMTATANPLQTLISDAPASLKKRPA